MALIVHWRPCSALGAQGLAAARVTQAPAWDWSGQRALSVPSVMSHLLHAALVALACTPLGVRQSQQPGLMGDLSLSTRKRSSSLARCCLALRRTVVHRLLVLIAVGADASSGGGCRTSRSECRPRAEPAKTVPPACRLICVPIKFTLHPCGALPVVLVIPDFLAVARRIWARGAAEIAAILVVAINGHALVIPTAVRFPIVSYHIQTIGAKVAFGASSSTCGFEHPSMNS